MIDNSYPPEPAPVPPPVECCHYDEVLNEMCLVPALYSTFYRGIYVTFCEVHYCAWIVKPLLDGTLDPALVSRVAPGSEVAG